MTRQREPERRAIETRLAPDESGAFEGYASLWGKPDSFGDVLVKGAFAASLAQHRAASTMPLMFWYHDPTAPIGVWDEITEDARGLKVKGHFVLDCTAGRDIHALAKAGAVTGLSIGFHTTKATQLPKGGRRVEAVDLIEISPCTRPSQSAARITSVRSEPAAAGLAAFIRRCAEQLGAKTR
jgi:hypothetical protein